MGKSADKRMDELKRGKSCMDCLAEGINVEWPTECLQFDHREPDLKSGSIRDFIWHQELLDAELAKCDVVCANHHSIRTRKRGVSEKTRAAIKAARNRPGSKERDSKLHKELWKKNHENRANAVRASQQKPEVREKMKLATAGTWKDDAVRKRRQEGMVKAWVTRKEKQSKSSA